MEKLFVSAHDVEDIKAWSGIPYHMFRAMKKVDPAWKPVGPLPLKEKPLFRWKHRLYARLGQQYWPNYEISALKEQAHQVSLAAGRKPAIILSVHPDPVVFLEEKHQVSFYGDATFKLLRNFYPALKNLCRESVNSGNRIWQLAAERSEKAFFSSDWARDSFIYDYGFSTERAHTIPFGANIDSDPDEETVFKHIFQRPRRPLKLIWIGVDWNRKGGHLAYQVAKTLNSNDEPTELHIVGCAPEGIPSEPSWLYHHGFLDKGNPDDAESFRELLYQSHFLVLPTLADCSPIVYNEACAHGVPCIGTSVGGAPTLVKNGVNGLLIDPDCFCNEAVAFILKCTKEINQYTLLAQSAYRLFERTLSWNAFSTEMGKHF